MFVWNLLNQGETGRGRDKATALRKGRGKRERGMRGIAYRITSPHGKMGSLSHVEANQDLKE